jgi:hypothetical protein
MLSVRFEKEREREREREREKEREEREKQVHEPWRLLLPKVTF